MKKIHIPLLVLLTIGLTNSTLVSCTDLDEVVLDEVLGDNAGSPEGALAAAYDRLGDGTFVDNGSVFAMQEYSTDEALLPTRGSDWGDGGKWRAMHEFTWAADNPVVSGTWNQLTNGIVRSLTAIKSIENSEIDNKAMFLAEAKTLLAYYTYTTLDLYGQAPYRDPALNDAPLEIRKADTYIDTLIAEVEAVVPDLASLGENSTHNGRFTKEAAYGFLAQLYLNRAVLKDRYNASSSFNFTEATPDGSTDMDKVIQYTTLLIGSPKFSLKSNYFDNFAINNSGGSELIFAITQKTDNIRNGDNDFAYTCMERNQKPSPANRGTNASCATPQWYASWEGNHDDPRFHRYYQYGDGTWFMNDATTTSVPASDIVPNSNGLLWFHFNRGVEAGMQYGPKLVSSSAFEMTLDGRIKVSPLVMEKSTTTPMDFTPELNFDDPTKAIFAQNQINRGVRIFKYEFDPEGGNGPSNVDIPLIRLGAMYSMRAEAYFRKGNTAQALADINTLRTSRTRESLFGNAAGLPIAALTEQVLYNEISFETYWEMLRRPQMIRFGKFDAADLGSAKPASQPFRRVFPIPQETLDVSKEFSQNFGYEQ